MDKFTCTLHQRPEAFPLDSAEHTYNVYFMELIKPSQAKN
jgi:hypothetical protein